MDKKHFAGGLTLFLIGAFVLAAFLGYHLATPKPLEKDLSMMMNSVPERNKVVFQEGHEICITHQLDCLLSLEAPEDIDLTQVTLAELMVRYPQPQWRITEAAQVVYITKQLEGLCAAHKQIIHLGENSGGEYVALYYGPAVVGNDGGVMRVTNIALQSLPLEEQEKIRAGTVEIYSDDELIGLLDSLSEME